MKKSEVFFPLSWALDHIQLCLLSEWQLHPSNKRLQSLNICLPLHSFHLIHCQDLLIPLYAPWILPLITISTSQMALSKMSPTVIGTITIVFSCLHTPLKSVLHIAARVIFWKYKSCYITRSLCLTIYSVLAWSTSHFSPQSQEGCHASKIYIQRGYYLEERKENFASVSFWK